MTQKTLAWQSPCEVQWVTADGCCREEKALIMLKCLGHQIVQIRRMLSEKLDRILQKTIPGKFQSMNI